MKPKMPKPVYYAASSRFGFYRIGGPNGTLHNDHGPAVIDINGQTRWYYFGREVRLGSQRYSKKALRIPNCLKWAMIKHQASLILKLWKTTPEMQEYALRRKPRLVSRIHNLHPEIKAKHERYKVVNKKDQIEKETHYFWGSIHRDSGPAFTSKTLDGNLICHQWWCDGNMSRLDGPAMIDYHLNRKTWRILGQELSKAHDIHPELKWMLLKGDPEVVTVLKTMDKDMQEYLVEVRPDLISEIPDLLPEVKAKFEHEIALSKVDL
jgi:hypothetical protein